MVPRAVAQLVALAVALLAGGGTEALPALTPCAAAANGASGRWGICARGAAGEAHSPLALRGSNYIRLGGSHCTGGVHTTFDAGVYNRTRYVAAFESMQAQGCN